MACENVKAWLSQAGVDFIAYNVATDMAAYDALLALGVRRVPLTVIDGRLVAGFQPEALAEALSARRATSDPGTP
ncbi:MAG: glutaredoxin family protein [Acidobacteria bacterium]|nr:glutaredoxin family protein [Acidobacteriota bacterium]